MAKIPQAGSKTANVSPSSAVRPQPAATPAATPVAAPSAAPGTKDEKAKKEKKTRVAYPGLIDAEGKAVKLSAIPDDFDPRVHKPLSRKNLEDESLWFELKARDFERKAASMRAKGEELKKLGNVADRNRAKRFLNLQKRYEELKAQLVGQGIDVDEMLSKMSSE